jgi:hypothetical protein
MPLSSPRATAQSFDTPPLDWENEEEHRRKLAEALIGVMDGKINAIGTLTLAASSATTTLRDKRIGLQSRIFFMPTTANAAAAITSLFVTGRGKQTATINHANNSQTDKTFDYVVLG